MGAEQSRNFDSFMKTANNSISTPGLKEPYLGTVKSMPKPKEPSYKRGPYKKKALALEPTEPMKKSGKMMKDRGKNAAEIKQTAMQYKEKERGKKKPYKRKRTMRKLDKSRLRK